MTANNLQSTAALESWAGKLLADYHGPITLSELTGGQSNPSYLMHMPGRDYVLRRQPSGTLLAGAHRIDREYKVLQALEDTAVPVPRVHGYCDDPTVIGSCFYLMDFVPGEIFHDQLMSESSATDRKARFDSMNSTLAALHSIDPNTVGLASFGRAADYIGRQLKRWGSVFETAEGQMSGITSDLLRWLQINQPSDREGRILHGDYKIDNLVFHPDEPRVAAVLDWELSTIGDPIADFAYHAMAWHLEPHLFRGFAGVIASTPGLPTLADYVTAYERRTESIPMEHWRFYIVFSMFRLAGILFGISKRARAGNAASQDAQSVGSRALPVAARAWELANTSEALL